MLTEIELRERMANLQQRALDVGSRSKARIDALTTATQTLPELHPDEYLRMVRGATDDAMMAALSYHRSAPFLETANSLARSLAEPPPSVENEEWREQLLFRLFEVLEIAEGLIGEGEASLESSDRIQV